MENKSLVLTQSDKDVCMALENISKSCSLQTLENSGGFERALIVANGVNQLRAAITPEMVKKIMPLMNTQLGFLTDKDPKKPNKDGSKPVPYSEEVVKECFIVATLQGLAPVNNEFNILFGQCYATKNGYRSKLKKLPGMSDLQIVNAIAKPVPGGAIVSISATYKFNGNPRQTSGEYTVKLQGQMGFEAAIAKAERRIFKKIHEELTGTIIPDGEVDDDIGSIPTTATKVPEKSMEEKIKENQGKKPPTDAQRAVQALPEEIILEARKRLNINTLITDLSDLDCDKFCAIAQELENPSGEPAKEEDWS